MLPEQFCFFASEFEKKSEKTKRNLLVLDRDGVVINDGNYLADPEKLEPLHDSLETLARIDTSQTHIVIISNQSGIARGLITIAQFHAVHERLKSVLQEYHIEPDATLYCPYLKDGTIQPYAIESKYRKPETGMVDLFTSKLKHVPARKFVIGDKCSDIKMGVQLGAASALVRTGHGAEEENRCRLEYPQANIYADLGEALYGLGLVLA